MSLANCIIKSAFSPDDIERVDGYVQNYIDQGYNQNEAERLAVRDFGKDVQKYMNNLKTEAGLENDVVEEDDFTLPEPPPSSDGKKRRKIADRYLNDPDVSEEVKTGLSEEGKNYIPTTNKLREVEADAIIHEQGTENAIKYIKDSSNGLRDDLRAFIGKRLYAKIKEQIKSTEDGRTRAKLYEELNDLIETVAKMGTRAGQTVQAFTEMFTNDPEAVAFKLRKEVNKLKMKGLDVHSDEITSLAQLVKDADEQTIKELLSEPRVQKVVQESQKKQTARKKFTKNVLDYLDKLESDINEGSDQANDVTYLLGAKLYKAAIDIIRKAVKAGDSLADAVSKAIDHVKSNHEGQWDENGFRKLFDPQIAKEQREDRKTVVEVLEEQDTDITELALSHYTQVDQSKKSFSEKLQEKGVSESEAKRLGKAMDDMIAARRRKILESKYVKKVSTPGSKKKQKQLVEKIADASNLGALSDKQMRDMYAESMGIPNISDKQAQEIDKLVDKAEQLPEGYQKYKAVQEIIDYHTKIKGITPYQIAESIWYANILSGLSTQTLNFQANSVQAVAEIYVSGVQTAIENPRAAAQHFMYILDGAVKGVKEALPISADIIKTGSKPLKDFKFDKDNSVKGITGQRSDVLELLVDEKGQNKYMELANKTFTNWKYVSRLMMATDMLFYGLSKGARRNQLAYREALNQNKDVPGANMIKEADKILGMDDASHIAAREKATQEGLSGRDLTRRTNEIIDQQMDQAIVEDSNDFAARATFNYDPEGILGVFTGILNNATQKVPPLKIVVPFTRIISNVTNQYLDWTPWGLIRAAKGGIGLDAGMLESYTKYSPEEKQRVIIKATTGTMAMVALYAMMQSDEDEEPFLEITADGTGSFYKNYELQATGWKAYTFKVNAPGMDEVRFEYRNTPLGIPFAMLGYLSDLEKYKEGKFTESTTAALFSGFFQYISDMSFLASLQEFFQIISQDSRGSSDISGKMLKYTERSARGLLVPNVYTQMSRLVQETTDTPIKKASNFYETLIRDVPYFRDGLKNIHNTLGDPVVPEQAYKFNPIITRFSIDEDPQTDTDRVWEMIVNAKAYIGAPSKNTTIFDKDLGTNRTLTDDEYHEYAIMAGQETKKILLENYDQIVALEDVSEQKKLINKLKSAARKIAKQKMANQLKDL